MDTGLASYLIIWVGVISLVGHFYALALWLVKKDGQQGTVQGFLAMAAYPAAYIGFVSTLLFTESRLYAFIAWTITFVVLWAPGVIQAFPRKNSQ